jgi:hypothetical protein
LLKARINIALVLLATGIVINLIILVRGDESPGLPIITIAFLCGAGISLLAERREP